MTKRHAKERLQKLRTEIEHQRYLYHVLDQQELSDAALDSLKHELAQLEEAWPDLVTPDSPTQRVAGQPLPQFKHVMHRTPMLSLQDVFSAQELEAWEQRINKIVLGESRYFAELKIDGVAVALVYEDGLLVYGATRGDGVTGEDVTHNLRTVEAIPLRLRIPAPGRVEVRGEVYLRKRDFERMNQDRAKAGQPLFANPRNIAAGSIRQLDPAIAAARPLRFFAWEITAGQAITTRQEEYRQLQALGFSVPPRAELLLSLAQVSTYLARQAKRRLTYPFLVDGVVIKVDDLRRHVRLGVVGKAPRGAVAYKFTAEQATTIVEDIVVQVGRTGALTPVAHLRPVAIAGSTVSRASLHNADEIRRKDIRRGDTVVVHKAGDIIPEVVKIVPSLRPAGSKAFAMPRACPMCGTPSVRDPDGVVVRCPNRECFPIQREKIIHAVSDAGFAIDGLGDKIVESFLQAGLIKDPPDLWELKEGDIEGLPGFAAKSAQKLIVEIKAHQKVALANFLVALSIPGVGTVTAQDLAREFRTLARLTKASATTLEKVAGIGPIVAQNIAQFFASSQTKTLLVAYRAGGVRILEQPRGGRLEGQSFLFTGSLPDMSRDEAKQRVQVLGGKVVSAAGQDVTYVVIGDEPGSKAARARALGVTTLTPTQFLAMIGEV